GGTPDWTSRSEPHDIVRDVTDEETPPNNERQNGGQGRRCPVAFIGERLTPAYPICWQQAEADRNEILLEIEESERMPVAIAFQVGLNVNLEVEVDDRPKQCSAQVQTNDGIGVPGWLHGAEAGEEGTWMGARRCPCRQRLVRDRAEQRDRDETMQYQKRRRHSPSRRDDLGEQRLGPERLGRSGSVARQGEFRLLPRFDIHQDVVELLFRRLAFPVELGRIIGRDLDAGAAGKDRVLFRAPTA